MFWKLKAIYIHIEMSYIYIHGIYGIYAMGMMSFQEILAIVKKSLNFQLFHGQEGLLAYSPEVKNLFNRIIRQWILEGCIDFNFLVEYEHK